MTYIRPGEAAEMLGVSRDAIRRYSDAGRIDAIVTPGGHRRIGQGKCGRLHNQAHPHLKYGDDY